MSRRIFEASLLHNACKEFSTSELSGSTSGTNASTAMTAQENLQQQSEEQNGNQQQSETQQAVATEVEKQPNVEQPEISTSEEVKGRNGNQQEDIAHVVVAEVEEGRENNDEGEQASTSEMIESAPSIVVNEDNASSSTATVREDQQSVLAIAPPASTPETTKPAETQSQEVSTSIEGPTSTANESESTEASAPSTSEDSPEGDTPAGEETKEEGGVQLEEMKRVWSELGAAKENRSIVEMKVTGMNRGGVVGEYNSVEIFVPQSHWSISRQSGSTDALVGQSFPVQILEITQFETDARRVTGTRRSILRKELLENLKEGDKVTGRVSTLTDFGAFVDLGGVDGLLHVSEISYERSKIPNDLLKKGQEIEVLVKKIENGGKRISLSRKELLESPWSGVGEKFPLESTQSGRVVSLTEIGAFVQLEPGIVGLIRPREISWTQRVHSAADVLSVGQEVTVVVLSLDESKERISLSLKRAEENPWPGIVDKFSGDQTWQGVVRELSNKGVVVNVEGVEGFLPRGRMGREANKLTGMKVGDTLTVRVVEIDPKRPSIIFSLPREGGGSRGGGNRGGERRRGRDGNDRPTTPVQPVNEIKSSETVGNFSLGDMLGDASKEKLGVEPAKEETPAPVAKTELKQGESEEKAEKSGVESAPPSEPLKQDEAYTEVSSIEKTSSEVVEENNSVSTPEEPGADTSDDNFSAEPVSTKESSPESTVENSVEEQIGSNQDENPEEVKA